MPSGYQAFASSAGTRLLAQCLSSTVRSDQRWLRSLPRSLSLDRYRALLRSWFWWGSSWSLSLLSHSRPQSMRRCLAWCGHAVMLQAAGSAVTTIACGCRNAQRVLAWLDLFLWLLLMAQRSVWVTVQSSTSIEEKTAKRRTKPSLIK